MDQDTQPAPFNLGDHVRYVGREVREAPGGAGDAEVVLTAGMVGTVMLSTGALAAAGSAAPKPWRCRVQFANGYQIELTPANRADFEIAPKGEGSPTA